jgi:8-oxo-dGTP diphosphatase
MKGYVLGFVFSSDGRRVVLIEKRRPDWQAGKLNGIGGRAEPGETPIEAMIREFKEETGVDTVEADWSYLGVITGEDVQVVLFKAFRDKLVLDVATMTDERVCLINPSILYCYQCVPNVPGLVNLALDPQRPMVALSYDKETPAP